MTISEIAKLAGVSSAAVSRYLNNGYLSEEKRAIIKKVIDETGYKPSAQAQNLRNKKTNIIGVILPKIDSSSIGRVVTGIQSVIEEAGYQMLLATTQNNPDKELEYLEALDETRVDGILFLATIISAKHKELLKNSRVPVVVIGQHLSGINCVYHDDYHAIYDLTNRMLDTGRKNIAYIGGLPEDVALGKERLRGFQDAVKENDLEKLGENYVISSLSMESGYEMAKKLMEKDDTIDGIICVTDRVAVGALKYLKQIKKRIPEEIAVTGHGDSVMSRVVEPTLTTIHYHYEDSGVKAAEILTELLQNGTTSTGSICMGYSIINNESM